MKLLFFILGYIIYLVIQPLITKYKDYCCMPVSDIADLDV